jgi:hypothetical protein
MTTQGVARSIHLFRKVVRSALIGVHSLDQIDVGRANFLFGRSRLQTENLQRSGDAHAFVANGLARLPAVWLSPRPFPPSPFVGVFLPSACELLHSALAGFLILLPTRLLLMERPLRKRPVQKAPCDDGFQRRRRAPCPSRKASQREAEHQNPKATGTMTKSAKSEPPSSTRYG